MMNDLTWEEVNAAIRKHLQVDNLVIAMVTAEASRLEEALVSDGPSSIAYGQIAKSQETLDEDMQIERYPLRIPAGNVRIVPVYAMFAE